MINNASPEPDSDNPQFIKNGLELQSLNCDDFHAIAKTWVDGGIKKG